MTIPPISSLLPQQGAMRLLGALLRSDAKGATAEATVREDWPGMTADGADAALVVELIAQTAAAWQSALHISASPHPGMLVGIKEVEFRASHLALGLRLQVEIETVWNRGPLRLVRGWVRREGETLGAAVVHVLCGPVPDASSDEEVSQL